MNVDCAVARLARRHPCGCRINERHCSVGLPLYTRMVETAEAVKSGMASVEQFDAACDSYNFHLRGGG